MTNDPQWVLTAGGLAIAAIVWMVRLEGRITTNEKITNSLSEDVRYIRQRIDQALNGD